MHSCEPITVGFRGGAPTVFTWRGCAYRIYAIVDRTRPALAAGTPAGVSRFEAEPDLWQVRAAPPCGKAEIYLLRYTPRTSSWSLID